MIYLVKIREVKTPVRAFSHDAGIDFFLPKLDNSMIEALKAKASDDAIVGYNIYTNEYYVRLNPGERVAIPSGLKSCFYPKDSALIAFNKSGLAANKGIITTAQVVDSDYTGEIHVGILNTSKETLILKEGDKIGQFIHTPIYLSEIRVIDNDTYDKYTKASDRGEGGFGSTDKK